MEGIQVREEPGRGENEVVTVEASEEALGGEVGGDLLALRFDPFGEGEDGVAF
jgi:hypothetical protein